MKLLALIPIVGIALALNAETVNDYVYQQPQKKIVKKGKKNATAKMGNNTIEIVPSKEAAEQAAPAKTVEWVVAKEPDKKPIVLLEGHRITYETFTRMDPDEIASITVLKDQPAVDQYGEEARNGVILITTKQGVEVFTPVEQNPEYFDVVEQMPEFPGGAQALFGFVAKNIRYPKAAEDAGIQGRVIVTFVVCKDGSICDAKVVKSVSPALDAEGLRVISSMPNWTPGTQSGKAVNVKYTVPISFRLDGNSSKKDTPEAIQKALPSAEVKMIRIDGQEVPDIDLEVDGKKVETKDWQKHLDPKNIKSITLLRKDADHPKDRVIVTTK